MGALISYMYMNINIHVAVRIAGVLHVTVHVIVMP